MRPNKSINSDARSAARSLLCFSEPVMELGPENNFTRKLLLQKMYSDQVYCASLLNLSLRINGSWVG